MVEHRQHHRLQCHQCGHAMPVPDACPECRSEGTLVACGPGGERIADEGAALLPDARPATVASDPLWSTARATALLDTVQEQEVDRLVRHHMVQTWSDNEIVQN